MARSADKLVAARDARAGGGVPPGYNKELQAAHALSRTAGTPTEHRAAAVAFRKAAASADGDRSRDLHSRLADNHDRMALAEEQGGKDLPRLNQTAAQIHQALAGVVSDPEAKKYHLAEASKHRNMAGGSR